MVYHVGYDVDAHRVCIYNSKKYLFCKIRRFYVTNFYHVRTKRRYFPQIFKRMLANMKGEELGCFCVFVGKCDNIERKNVIECGSVYNFKKIELIDPWTSYYLSIALRTKYKPKNGDVIWIVEHRNGFIYTKENGIAVLVESFSFWEDTDYDEFFSGKRIPNAIFSNSAYVKLLDKKKIKKMFPSSIWYSFNSVDYAYSAMVYARKMANDPEVIHWNVQSLLLWETTIMHLFEKVVVIKAGSLLPLTRTFKISDNKYYKITVLQGNFHVQEFAHPGIVDCIISIDKSGIIEIQKLEDAENNNENNPCSIQDSSDSADPTASITINTLPEPERKFFQECAPMKYESVIFKFPSKISPMDGEIEAVGIDFGISRCCMAVNRRRGIETVALENAAGRHLPSYVAFDEINEKCGQIVVSRLRYHYQSTVFDVKRLIGKSMNEIEIDPIWPYSVKNLNNKIVVKIMKCNEMISMEPEKVSASLLKYIKETCETFQGKTLSKVVVTIPAVFTESQKIAIIAAAKLAGWNTVHLLPEPIAASFAYFVDRPIPNQSTILLFDLGGGTLDVCISKIENDEIKIILQNGDSQLGGRDFDKILINYFQNIFLADYGISMENIKYKLMLECQNLKEILSDVETASLYVNDFDPAKEGVIEITRAEFLEMTVPLLNRIENTILTALFYANIQPSQINNVLQVGGGSRMPMIKQLLQKIFEDSEHCCETNPDEVVAIGAAHYAYNLFSS